MVCNIEDTAKIISIKKKFFLKSFFISLILLMLCTFIISYWKEFWVNLTHRLYGLNSEHYVLIAAILMGAWKILLVQFTLVPFLALTFLEICARKKGC